MKVFALAVCAATEAATVVKVDTCVVLRLVVLYIEADIVPVEIEFVLRVSNLTSCGVNVIPDSAVVCKESTLPRAVVTDAVETVFVDMAAELSVF